jgi:hypothetical protein
MSHQRFEFTLQCRDEHEAEGVVGLFDTLALPILCKVAAESNNVVLTKLRLDEANQPFLPEECRVINKALSDFQSEFL